MDSFDMTRKTNDLTTQTRRLIEESKKLRLQLQQAVDELREVREQVRHNWAISIRNRETSATNQDCPPAMETCEMSTPKYQ